MNGEEKCIYNLSGGAHFGNYTTYKLLGKRYELD
jgi:hypothetical protein